MPLGSQALADCQRLTTAWAAGLGYTSVHTKVQRNGLAEGDHVAERGLRRWLVCIGNGGSTSLSMAPVQPRAGQVDSMASGPVDMAISLTAREPPTVETRELCRDLISRELCNEISHDVASDSSHRSAASSPSTFALCFSCLPSTTLPLSPSSTICLDLLWALVGARFFWLWCLRGLFPAPWLAVVRARVG